MDDDAPRRPRTSSLDVVFIVVTAMLALAFYTSTYSFLMIWGQPPSLPRWLDDLLPLGWRWPNSLIWLGGALVLIAAAIVVRVRRRGSHNTPRQPRRASLDVVLMVAAMLALAFYTSTYSVLRLSGDWWPQSTWLAELLWLGYGWPTSLIWLGSALVLLAAAVVVRLRRS